MCARRDGSQVQNCAAMCMLPTSTAERVPRMRAPTSATHTQARWTSTQTAPTLHAGVSNNGHALRLHRQPS